MKILLVILVVSFVSSNAEAKKCNSFFCKPGGSTVKNINREINKGIKNVSTETVRVFNQGVNLVGNLSIEVNKIFFNPKVEVRRQLRTQLQSYQKETSLGIEVVSKLEEIVKKYENDNFFLIHAMGLIFTNRVYSVFIESESAMREFYIKEFSFHPRTMSAILLAADIPFSYDQDKLRTCVDDVDSKFVILRDDQVSEAVTDCLDLAMIKSKEVDDSLLNTYIVELKSESRSHYVYRRYTEILSKPDQLTNLKKSLIETRQRFESVYREAQNSINQLDEADRI